LRAAVSVRLPLRLALVIARWSWLALALRFSLPLLLWVALLLWIPWLLRLARLRVRRPRLTLCVRWRRTFSARLAIAPASTSAPLLARRFAGCRRGVACGIRGRVVRGVIATITAATLRPVVPALVDGIVGAHGARSC
jgi:hypothetical protein